LLILKFTFEVNSFFLQASHVLSRKDIRHYILLSQLQLEGIISILNALSPNAFTKKRIEGNLSEVVEQQAASQSVCFAGLHVLLKLCLFHTFV